MKNNHKNLLFFVYYLKKNILAIILELNFPTKTARKISKYRQNERLAASKHPIPCLIKP